MLDIILYYIQDHLRHNYGDLPINRSQSTLHHWLTPATTLTVLPFSSSRAQSFVLHRHHQSWHTRHSASTSPSLAPTRYSSSVSSLSVPLMRFIGAKLVFLILRHQLTTVQAIVTEEDGIVSQNMVRWAEGIARESIVLIEGVLQEPGGQPEVKSATVHKVEIKVEKVCCRNGRILLSNVIFSSSLSSTRPQAYHFKSNRCPALQSLPTPMSETRRDTTTASSTSV